MYIPLSIHHHLYSCDICSNNPHFCSSVPPNVSRTPPWGAAPARRPSPPQRCGSATSSQKKNGLCKIESSKMCISMYIYNIHTLSLYIYICMYIVIYKYAYIYTHFYIWRILEFTVNNRNFFLLTKNCPHLWTCTHCLMNSSREWWLNHQILVEQCCIQIVSSLSIGWLIVETMWKLSSKIWSQLECPQTHCCWLIYCLMLHQHTVFLYLDVQTSE